MPGRLPVRGARQMLEWGMLSEHPGSLVRDARNAPVFTGSLVCSATFELLTGVVTELLDASRVQVLWSDAIGKDAVVVLAPSEVIVLEPLPAG